MKPARFARPRPLAARVTAACAALLALSAQAANWEWLGRTTGRGKDDLTHRANRPVKDVLGYPLTKRFRQLLGGAS